MVLSVMKCNLDISQIFIYGGICEIIIITTFQQEVAFFYCNLIYICIYIYIVTPILHKVLSNTILLSQTFSPNMGMYKDPMN